MEIRVLKYFIAVVREGSFTKAARKLFITQPTLSRQLKALEDEYGVKLLKKGKDGVTLTEAGYILYQKAKEIVALSDGLEKELNGVGEELSGLVKIGSVESEGAARFFKELSLFIAAYPDVSYDIYNGYSSDILDRLDTGELDLAVLTQPVDVDKYDYIEFPEKDTWGLIVSKDHKLAGRESVTWNDLEGEPLAAPMRFSKYHDVPKIFANAPADLNIVATFNLLSNALRLAEEGLVCIPCMDSVFKRVDSDRVKFIGIKPTMRTGSVLVWRGDSLKGSAGRALLDFTLKRLQEDDLPE